MAIDGGLYALFKKALKDFDWQRIENLVGLGVPDTNFCHAGVEGWIEFKAVNRGQKIKFRPAQPGWISRRARAGGRVFIAVRYRSDDLRIYHGRDVIALASGRMDSVEPLLHMTGGPRHWDWEKVKSLILQ